MIVDNRDGKDKVIEYLAMPVEVIKGGGMPVPDIELIQTEGLDGIIRDYIAVVWQELKHNNTKKYDVAGHIVIAGCDPSTASKEDDGSLICTDKNVYIVLHPVQEWIDQHIIELSKSYGPIAAS